MDLNCKNPGNVWARDHCELGLISMSGAVAVDDTGRPRLFHPDDPKNPSDTWQWVDTSGKMDDPGACASIPAASRRDCGHTGITEQQCLARGCCSGSYNAIIEAAHEGTRESFPGWLKGKLSRLAFGMAGAVYVARVFLLEMLVGPRSVMIGRTWVCATRCGN